MVSAWKINAIINSMSHVNWACWFAIALFAQTTYQVVFLRFGRHTHWGTGIILTVFCTFWRKLDAFDVND